MFGRAKEDRMANDCRHELFGTLTEPSSQGQAATLSGGVDGPVIPEFIIVILLEIASVTFALQEHAEVRHQDVVIVGRSKANGLSTPPSPRFFDKKSFE